MVDIRSEKYPIRESSPDFDIHGEQPVARVKQIVESLDAKAFVTAGTAYLNAGTKLAETMQTMEDVAVTLSKIWGDKASAEFQASMRAIYITMKNLKGSCNQIGRQFESMGKTVIPAFKDTGGAYSWDDDFSMDDSLPDLWVGGKDFGEGGASRWFRSDRDGATEHLQKLSAEMKKIHDLLPMTVDEDLPKIRRQYEPPPTFDPDKFNKNSPGPGSPSFTTPDFNTNPGDYGKGTNPSPGPGPWPDPTYPGGTKPGDGTGPGGTGPNGNYPGGPDGNGPTSPDFPGQGDGSHNPNLPPGAHGVDTPRAPHDPTSGMNTPSARETSLAGHEYPKVDTPDTAIDTKTGQPINTDTHAGTGTRTVTGTGSGHGEGSGYGANGANGGVTQASARGASTSGMGGFPVAPAGSPPHGQEDKKNEHSTWLHEEDDVYTGHIDAVNHTIGQVQT